MELYFSPLACSLATRIAFYEAGYEAGYVQVDTKRKQLQDGSDFFAVNPLGQVPVLCDEPRAASRPRQIRALLREADTRKDCPGHRFEIVSSIPDRI